MVSTAQREKAAAILAGRLGLHFPENRAADLDRAVKRAMRACNLGDADRFVDWLATLPHDSSDLARVAGLFTVGETYFFRNPEYFVALEHTLLPRLIAARRAHGSRCLRMWSAGCATGEEAYSLAIVVNRLLPDLADWSVTILATDIDAEALATARRGVYRRWSLRQGAADAARPYLRPHGSGRFEIAQPIRQMVTFQVLNLAGEAYPSIETNTVAMDLIVCRNVLMYLTPEAQRGVLGRLAAAIVPGGWLMVAPAEGPIEPLPGLGVVSFPGAAFYERESTLEPAFVAWPALEERPIPASGVGGSGESVTSMAPAPSVPDRRSPERAPRTREAAGRATAAETAPSPMAEARSLADSGRLDEAYLLCQRRVSENALDGHAYLLLGRILQERGETRRAIAALRQCIYLMPASAAAHFLLAGLLQRESNHRQARRALETVIGLLEQIPDDEIVEDGGGLTARRLVALARAQAAAIAPAGHGRGGAGDQT